MKYIFITALSCALLWNCGGNNGHNDEDHDKIQSEEVHGHENEIFFSDDRAQAAGIRTIVAEPSPFRQVFKVSGMIVPAAGDDITIVATTAGVIDFSSGDLTEGSSLSQGRKVATIVSRNIAQGDNFAQTKVEFASAEKEYLRGRELVKDQIISAKDFDQLEARYQSAKIAFEALQESSTGQGIGITSPVAGYVKGIMVSQGQYVAVGDPILVVSRNRRLQLRADVPQRYCGDLPYVSGANFRLPYQQRIFRLEDMNGKLLSVGKASAEGSPYIPVTFDFDNREGVIAGSYAEVFLLSRTLENVISLPVEALTEEQGHFFVYLKVHPQEYIKREVTPGRSDGVNIEITAGLAPGEEVVVSGAYQLKLASVSSVIPEGHAH